MMLVGVLQMASNAVFVVILVIIMVGITNSYRMVILERVQEIGTMRAMGAQRNWVFNLFVSESVMIAVLGSAAGILASLGLMALLGSIKVGGASGPMQLFSIANHLQFPVTLGTFAGPVIITLMSNGATWSTISRMFRKAELLPSNPWVARVCWSIFFFTRAWSFF